MKKICICYFSGTGMTKYIVDKLSREFENYKVLVKYIKIEEFLINRIDFSDYNMFGIAYPVHAFNAPEIVVDFVEKLPVLNGLDTFIIGSMGEDNILNYAASQTLMNKLKLKGYNVFYNKLFEMPCNFIIKYKPSRVVSILENIDDIMPNTSKEILSLTTNHMDASYIAKCLSVMGKAEWFGARAIGKFFYVTTSCTMCGKCMNNCPNQNISKRNNTIRFAWRCGLCMRCIYQCPTNAIRVHQPFRGIRIRDWYDVLEEDKNKL